MLRGIWGMLMVIGLGIRGLSISVAIGRLLVVVGVFLRGIGDRLSVVDAVERDLAEIRRLHPDLADSALAATALVMAQELDSSNNSATSKSMCARALSDTLSELRALAPPAEKKDGLDDLTARRTARLAAGRAAS